MRRITGIALLALLVVMGCEQATDGNFEGLLSGDRETSDWLPPPSVERQGTTIVLTWTPSNKASYQYIWRKSSSDEDYSMIGTIVDKDDHALPASLCTFTDYFTDPGKTYVYYTIGGYFMSDVGDWNTHGTKDTAPIQGAGTIPVPTSVVGSSAVTFNKTSGVLTFNPALPTFPDHAKAGQGKTLLEFDQTISTSLQIDEMGIVSVTVQELPFEWSFDYVDKELSISYTPVYQKEQGNVRTLVCIPHTYELTGEKENIKVPLPPLAAPTGLSATARDDGSIYLSWDSVPEATSYEVYWASEPYGNYLANPAVTRTTASFQDYDVDPDETVYYKVLAKKGNQKSALSEFVKCVAPARPPEPPVLEAPYSPPSIQVSRGTTSIGVSWGAVTDVDYYNIYRAVDSGTAIYITQKSDTSYIDTNVSQGRTYSYTIYSVKGGVVSGSGTTSREVSLQVPDTNPSAGPPWNGSINTPNETKTYTFEAKQMQTYYIYWNDLYQGDGTKTLDIKVSLSSSSDSYIAGAFSNEDAAYNFPRIIVPAADCTVTLTVEARTAGNTGTYSIWYY